MSVHKNLDDKRRELSNSLCSLDLEVNQADQLLSWMEQQGLLQISPPRQNHPAMELITIKEMHTGLKWGTSYKPGNIIINVKRAKSASSGQLLSFIGKAEGISFDKPVAVLLTILGAIITIVAELSKIDITKEAAFVLTVLWENNQQDKVSVEKGFKLVNKTCEEQGRRLYTQAEYEEILDDLASIKSIDIRSNEIILMEKIWIKN